MRSFPWRPFPFRRGNGKETVGPIEVPIHGFLTNPIPVGMVTPARPYAEAAQGAGGSVEVPNSCTSVRPIPITELGGRRVLARQAARNDCDPLLLFQAAGTGRPASICRAFSGPNIRSRSGMTEGPICGCSISPIQARLGTVLVGFDPSALLSPITQFARVSHRARSRSRRDAVKAVDRACAQYVRAIPLSRGPGHRSRHFQTSRHTFIETSAQPSQPFNNPRRLDRPISQHDASPRLSLQREGVNGNAEIKGS
jgi:hypothetical protein